MIRLVRKHTCVAMLRSTGRRRIGFLFCRSCWAARYCRFGDLLVLATIQIRWSPFVQRVYRDGGLFGFGLTLAVGVGNKLCRV